MVHGALWYEMMLNGIMTRIEGTSTSNDNKSLGPFLRFCYAFFRDEYVIIFHNEEYVFTAFSSTL